MTLEVYENLPQRDLRHEVGKTFLGCDGSPLVLGAEREPGPVLPGVAEVMRNPGVLLRWSERYKYRNSAKRLDCGQCNTLVTC